MLPIDLQNTNKNKGIQLEEYLKKLSDILYDILGMSVIFIYIDFSAKHNFVTTDKNTKLPDKCFMIYINLSNSVTGDVYFNYVLNMDLNNPDNNTNSITGDTVNYIYTNVLSRSFSEKKTKQPLEITYNPYDREIELDVIEITKMMKIYQKGFY